MPDEFSKTFATPEPMTEPKSEPKSELAIRSAGDDVVTLQEALNDRAKANLRVDGNLGPVTLREVRIWQQSEGLEDEMDNGIVGPETWKSLGY